MTGAANARPYCLAVTKLDDTRYTVGWALCVQGRGGAGAAAFWAHRVSPSLSLDLRPRPRRQLFASGHRLSVVTGDLEPVEVITFEAGITCFSASATGHIAVAVRDTVVILYPATGQTAGVGGARGQCRALRDHAVLTRCLGIHVGPQGSLWAQHRIITVRERATSVAWHADGDRLLIGASASLSLWCRGEEDPVRLVVSRGVPSDVGLFHTQPWSVPQSTLSQVWATSLASPPYHLAFAPEKPFFLSAGEEDCFVKLWFPACLGPGAPDLGEEPGVEEDRSWSHRAWPDARRAGGVGEALWLLPLQTILLMAGPWLLPVWLCLPPPSQTHYGMPLAMQRRA